MAMVLQQAGITSLAEDSTALAAETAVTESVTEVTAEDNSNDTSNDTTAAAETSSKTTEAASADTSAQTTETTAETPAPSASAAEADTTSGTAAEAETSSNTDEIADPSAADGETTPDTSIEETTPDDTTTEDGSEAETEAVSESEADTEEATEELTEAEATTEAEEATEDTAAASEEVETESEAETETETEAPKTFFTYSDSRVAITATASEAANLPQDAELKADYITPGSAAYNDAVSKIESQLGSSLGLNDENVETAYVLYDVYFVCDGEEVEPEAGTVSVSMVFRSAVDLGLTGEIVNTEVVHVKDSGEAEVVTDYVNVNENGDVTAMGFTQDSFSYTGLLMASEPMVPGSVDLLDIIEANSLSVTIKDSSGDEITASNPIGRDESFNIIIDYSILNTYKDSIANETTISYTLPEYVSVNVPFGYVTSKVDNTIIGEYSVVNNVLTFFLYDSFVQSNSNITGTFTITASANTEKISNQTSTTFTFPGTTTPTTLYFEDGTVDGSKTYVQNDDGTITFTIKLVLDADVTDLVLTDVLGSDFSFVSGSFALVDSSGTSTNISTTINGQTATVTIGSLSMGTYYLTYSVTVTDETAENSANKNTASWIWTFNNNSYKGETSVTVDMTKSWISKSGAKNSTDETRIDWTITVNGGTYRGNLNGKVITDTIGSGQTVDDTTIKIYDSNGNDCTTNSGIVINSTSDGFTVTFPNTDDYGKYTITYQTVVDGNNTSLSVTNTATTKDDSGNKTSDTGTVRINGILDKANTSANSDAFTAEWEAVINVSTLGSGISNVTFTDYLAWGQGTFDATSVTVKYADGTTLNENDYSVNVTNNDYDATLTVTFNIALSKNVVITYKTVYDKDSASSGSNTYYNGAKVKYTYEGETYEDKDSDTCELIKTVYIQKDDTTFKWDSSKNAYIATWEITVNPNGDNYSDGTYTVVDTLPSGLEYVTGTSHMYNHSDWQDNKSDPDISSDGLTLTYTLTNIGTNTYTIKYNTIITDTAVISKLLNNESVSYSNTVTLKQGDTVKGSDTAKGSVSNSSFLSKSVSQWDNAIGGNTTNLTYTIKVNTEGVDLNPDGTTITLEDYLDELLTLATDSISVVNGSTSATLSSSEYSVSYNSTTRLLSFTIPDNVYVIITFEATPNDATKSTGEYTSVSNTVSLSGTAITSTANKSDVQIVESSASAGGSASCITIKKISESLEALEGAEFELYRVSFSMIGGVYTFKTDGNGDFVSTLVDTQTTDDKGTLTFSYDPFSSDEKLQSDVLYYYKEVDAPDGYVLDSTETYFVIPGNSYSYIESALSTLNFTNWHSLKGGQTVDVTNAKDLTVSVQFGGTKTITGLPSGTTSS
ncbi:MAG: hypothetical protein LIO76_06035, partial [Clostridiales bacterium]|nr:hypothetical protein [Clostridiales bacterium]